MRYTSLCDCISRVLLLLWIYHVHIFVKLITLTKNDYSSQHSLLNLILPQVLQQCNKSRFMLSEKLFIKSSFLTLKYDHEPIHILTMKWINILAICIVKKLIKYLPLNMLKVLSFLNWDNYITPYHDYIIILVGAGIEY